VSPSLSLHPQCAVSARIDTVELAFETRELRKICEIAEYADGQLGEEVGQALRHRLADLWAASSPDDLLLGRPRLQTGQDSRMLLDLKDGVTILFCANHPESPRISGGDIAWSKVRRIKILGIGASHE